MAMGMFILLGVLLFCLAGILLVFFLPSRSYRVELQEKRKVGPWIEVVWKTRGGRIEVKCVDRELSPYLMHSEKGILVTHPLRGGKYCSFTTGLTLPITSVFWQKTKVVVPLMLVLALLFLPYWYGYPHLRSTLEKSLASETNPSLHHSKRRFLPPPVVRPLPFSTEKLSLKKKALQGWQRKLVDPKDAEKTFRKIVNHPDRWRKVVLAEVERTEHPYLLATLFRIVGHWKVKGVEVRRALEHGLRHSNPLVVWWANWALGKIYPPPYSLNWPFTSSEKEKCQKYWKSRK